MKPRYCKIGNRQNFLQENCNPIFLLIVFYKFENYCLLMLICTSRISHEQKKLRKKRFRCSSWVATEYESFTHPKQSHTTILNLHHTAQVNTAVRNRVKNSFISISGFFFAELCISGKAKIVSSSLNKFEQLWSSLNMFEQDWSIWIKFQNKTVLFPSVDFFCRIVHQSVVKPKLKLIEKLN